MQEVFAMLAPVVSLCAALPYVRDILRRQTRPNIVSWLTWALLTGLAWAASLALHEYRTAWLLGGSTLCSLIIVGLGMRYGVARMGRFDAVCAGLIGMTFILWAVSGSALLAIIAAVVVDALGVLPTLRHAWVSPYEETWLSFAGSLLAACLTLAALTSYSWASTLYPAYLAMANVVLVCIILWRRRHYRRQNTAL